MPISHHAYFEQIVRKVETVDPEVVAAVVSPAGLVLLSNVTDTHREAQLASYASTYLDYGRKMFSAGASGVGKEPKEDVQSIITVGLSHFVILAQLVAGSVLVLSGKDKSKISTFLKMALDEVNRVNALLAENEIMF